MWRPSLRVAVFLAMLALAFSFFLQLLNFSSSSSTNVSQIPGIEPASRQLLQLPTWVLAQKTNSMISLTENQLKTLSQLSNQEQFLKLLQPILIPRVSGTPGNLKVQQHITKTMTGLGYTIETDSFEDTPPAPHSRRTFTNIIATLDPNAPRRLVLACHFDSKFDNRGEFIGATDSAVPCAMLLDLATNLRGHVTSRQSKAEMTLQFLFLDGEEAFGEWSNRDSIYGSRHLANQLAKTPNKFAPENPSLTQINSIDLFLLLDLIGTTDSQFENFFPQTKSFYSKLAEAEDRLTNLKLIKNWGRKKVYFGRSNLPPGSFVDDDHRPFMEKGVPILHMISYPFPSVWHQYSDNFANIHYQTVDDLNKILRVFVCEYLSCRF